MIQLKSGFVENGVKEFYFRGLDDPNAFEIIVDTLIEMGGILLENFNGMYSRFSDIELSGKKIRVQFHEDIGVYSFLLQSQSEETNLWLGQILTVIIKRF